MMYSILIIIVNYNNDGASTVKEIEGFKSESAAITVASKINNDWNMSNRATVKATVICKY